MIKELTQEMRSATKELPPPSSHQREREIERGREREREREIESLGGFYWEEHCWLQLLLLRK